MTPDPQLNFSVQNSPEDGTTGLDLLEMINGRASHVTIGIQEDRETLQLLAHEEAQSCQHGDTTWNVQIIQSEIYNTVLPQTIT
jgi:hypothetical protein